MRIEHFWVIPLLLLLTTCSGDRQKAAHQKPDGPPIGHWERLPWGQTNVSFSGNTFTDHEYFAWSGNNPPPTPFMFDVTDNTWHVGSETGSPPGRYFSFAVWTGTEVIIWGGESTPFGPATGVPAGAYSPATDTWRMVSDVNSPSARDWTWPIWTGTEMIIWGGADTTTDQTNPPILGDGFAYNPVTDSWRTISTQGAPTPRIEVLSAWTGSELLVWGGTADTNNFHVDFADRPYLTSGAIYNPVSDTWRPMAVTGAPTQRRPTVSSWTGKEFLVWTSATGEGAAYNPTTDNWRPMDSRGPLLQYGSCGVWTGKYFVVCGDSLEPEGELYDPVTDRWYLMESQFVNNGPMGLDGGNDYAYNGDVYIFGGVSGEGGNGDLFGYRYVIP